MLLTPTREHGPIREARARIGVTWGESTDRTWAAIPCVEAPGPGREEGGEGGRTERGGHGRCGAAYRYTTYRDACSAPAMRPADAEGPKGCHALRIAHAKAAPSIWNVSC